MHFGLPCLPRGGITLVPNPIARIRAHVRDERGYTLIELLISMVLLGTITTALTTLFVSGSNAQIDQQHRFEAQETARVALDKLRKDAHYTCRLTVNSVTAPIGASTTLWFTDQTERGLQDPVGTCVHTAANSSYDITVTWCTSGSGARWALYRKIGASCSTSGAVKWADYLTSGNPFAYVAASPSSLARLHIDLPVNTNPTRSTQRYELSDDIALLDTVRQ